MFNNKQRGLGRDLQSLLNRGYSSSSPAAATTAAAVTPTTETILGDSRKLPIDVLSAGRYQPRRMFDPALLQELADSIKKQGIIQPLIVRSIGDKKYEIIAGERRWRAAQLAGLQEVPVIVRDINDETASAMALIENVQREDLNVMEQAIAYHRLTDEFQLTHEEVAELVGKSRTAISNMLRLLNLNPDVKRFVENGDLEMGHARALLGLSGAAQSEAARTITSKNLSVRETEQLVRRLQQESTQHKIVQKVDPDIRRLQNELSEKLGAKVDIQHTAKGRGKLVIHYESLDTFEGILDKLK